MHTYQIAESGTPLRAATSALILLHGRGGTAEGILSLAQHFPVSGFYLAAPQATNNTWYPKSFMADTNGNEPWLSSALEYIQKLLEDTAAYIPKERIYLMGFSQGACLTLETAARNADKLGGIAAFTGGLIGKQLNSENYQGDFAGTPVFISTGDPDPHVPVSRCEESKNQLENLNARVSLKIYKGRPHTITGDEIETVNKLLFSKNE